MGEPTPTKEQVIDALRGFTPNGRAAVLAAEAVMALLADTPQSSSVGVPAPPEAPQPQVLWRGETLPFTDMPGWEGLSYKCFNLDVPPGTRIAVVTEEAGDAE